MTSLNLKEDIRPVTEFRANAASLIEKVRQTQRPLVLTQRGRSAAVVLDVAKYEELLEELSLLKDIHQAEQQAAEGRGVAHAEARRRAMAALE